MNDDAAMSIATVYTCVSILADAVATLPLNGYVRTADKSKIPINPMPLLLTDPWPEGTLGDWLTQVMASLLLRGNFFGQIVDRDDFGFASMVKPIHPDMVMARRNEKTGQRMYWFSGKLQDPADVIHIPAMLMPGSFIGLNPVEYMRQSWSLAAAAEKYGGQFFGNSANPSGIISVEEDLGEDEVRAMAQSWKEAHGGLGNALHPAVLTGGAKWQQISISPDDAQFLQTRSFQKSEIVSFFRLPLSMVGESNPDERGMSPEDREIGFVTNTLAPWLNRLEQYLSKLIPGTQYAKFDVTGRLRGDTLSRFQSYTLAVNGGWLNNDEIRDREDLAPMPDDLGKTYWRPLNFAPADKIMDGTATPNGGAGGGLANDPNAPGKGTDTSSPQGVNV